MLHPPRLTPWVQLGFSMRANFWCRSRRRFGRWLFPFSIPVRDRGAKHAMVAGWMALENWTELNWTEKLHRQFEYFPCCCFPFQKLCCVSRARISHIGGLQLLLVFLLLLLLLHKVTSKVRKREGWWFSLGRGLEEKKWKVFKSDCELSWVFLLLLLFSVVCDLTAE